LNYDLIKKVTLIILPPILVAEVFNYTAAKLQLPTTQYAPAFLAFDLVKRISDFPPP
jgi:hypothetical protein